MNGETEVPISQSVSITFNERLITNTLVYTMTPKPGAWRVVWNPDHSKVLLRPWKNLLYELSYKVVLNVQNVNVLLLFPGPVPNPWSFITTRPSIFQDYLTCDTYLI